MRGRSFASAASEPVPSPVRAARSSTSPPAPRPRAPILGPDSPVTALRGVGPAKAALLEKLGLRTVLEILYYLPARHEDRSKLTPIRGLRVGDATTVIGTVKEIRPARSAAAPLTVTLTDSSGGLLNAIWFRQPHLYRVFQRGQRLMVHGQVGRFNGGLIQVVVKDFEILEDGDGETLHAGRLVPVYSLTAGITQRPFRAFMKKLVDRFSPLVEDPLPEVLRLKHKLLQLPAAIRACHFPADEADLAAGRRRLVYSEFFLLQLGLVIRRNRNGLQPGIAMDPPGALARRLLESLPFKLTSAQERVWSEIRADMAEPHPMNRLLQGDVGSGKTVVAALGMLTAIESGHQAALMVPTEILAEQHALVLTGLLAPLGVQVALLTGSVQGRERARIMAGLAAGEISCVVGTHAILGDEVHLLSLGLVVADEQHRFGVSQRATLRRKGENPDVLTMSATPIPRSLAATLYGDLEVSVIDQLPPGRQPVITRARGESARDKVYAFLRDQVREGRQVYVVCPLVEESEDSDLTAATEMAERLQRDTFPDLRVGLLHGRRAFAEKERVMAAFKAGAINVLVSTTVIEVGIDVPNASVMLIEHAERFGLSTLHQLRGRTGRGPWKSYCVLLEGGAVTEGAQQRIAAMVSTTDGFKIAEEDLALRGPGEVFGVKQAGHLLDFIRIADLVRDGAVLEVARQDAVAMVRDDPKLLRPEHQALRSALSKVWAGKLSLVGA